MPRCNTLPTFGCNSHYLPCPPYVAVHEIPSTQIPLRQSSRFNLPKLLEDIVTCTSLPNFKINWQTFDPWVVRAIKYPSHARAHRQGLRAWGSWPT